MKGKKFLVRRRTYNRQTADGLTHVINFQMGRFDLPGTVHIPWLRENYYRKFTINVGVYVPEVYIVQWGKERKFVMEYDCCVRERLGVLGPEHTDIWWDLQGDSKFVKSLGDELRGRLENDALPFLARFETRDALVKELLDPAAERPGGKVCCAIILAARGQLKEARDMLVAHKDEHIRSGGHPSHLEYLKELAAKLGVKTLEPS